MESTPPGADPALGRCVSAARTLFGAAACSVALVDEHGGTLEFVAADGAGARQIVGRSIPVGRGIAGWAAMSGQPIAVRDVGSDGRFARDVAESTNYVPTSISAAPLVDVHGEVLGVLSVLDPSVDAASEWSLDVLGTLAGIIALLVSATRGSAVPPQGSAHQASGRRDLGLLGADVLRIVDEWRARRPGDPQP